MLFTPDRSTYQYGGVRNLQHRSNAAGRRVAKLAESYVGTSESPLLSNRGTVIDRWNNYFGLVGQPWAGTFATSMFVEANVNDDQIGRASAQDAYLNAFAQSRVTRVPVVGCYVWYGILKTDGTPLSSYNLEIFLRWADRESFNMVTVGGNLPLPDATNDTVQIVYRNAGMPVNGNENIVTRFLVPRALSIVDYGNRRRL